MIGQRHSGRTVADEQECPHLFRILLDKQVNGEHQDVEAEQTDEQAYQHHNARDEPEEESHAPCIELVILHLVAFLVDIVHDGIVGRIADFQDDSRRVCGGIGSITLVAPANETLGGKYGVESRRETYHSAFDVFVQSVASHGNSHLHHTHDTLRELGQILALCKAEIVDGQIGLGQDDGHIVVTFAEVPLLQIHIDKGVGHTLEEHLRTYLCHTVDAHTARDLVLAGSKSTHSLSKRLRLEVFHLPFGESVHRTQTYGIERRDAFAEDEIIGADDTVFLAEDGLHIAIELKREQDYEHTQKVGEEKACKLRQTDVPAKEFPNKSHSFNILS